MIFAIDPGARSGWCLYHGGERRVLAAGQFDGHELTEEALEAARSATVVAIERPRGYGPTRPQLVDCGYTAGRLVGALLAIGRQVAELTRLDVCKRLSAAAHGVVHVRNDATAWAALLLLHGGDLAGKKGGPLHGVRAHERAALAVAVAVTCPASPMHRTEDGQ